MITMPSDIDKEIEAIGTVLKALDPLEPKTRQSVLAYVVRRLNIPTQDPGESPPAGDTPPPPPGESSHTPEEQSTQVEITDLVKQKQPRSAIEMATLVSYYLSHKVPQRERKQTIITKDLETHFKIAGFKLPTKPQFTLPNTKNAGYLDAVGSGEYKLNPVGYNLVVHSMPKSKKKSAPKGAKRKKTTKKKTSKV